MLCVSYTVVGANEHLQTLDKMASVHNALIYERVIDGDTFVASGRKIRLWGIDAPEKEHDAYFASKLLLEVLVSKHILTCKFIEKDRYDRDVMHCLSDGRDIGSMLVQMGMAKDFSKYSGDYYQFEENLAKKQNRGIWSK